MTGGQDSALNSLDNADLLIPGAEAISGGGINAVHEVVSSTSSVITLKTPAYPFYSSNTGDMKNKPRNGLKVIPQSAASCGVETLMKPTEWRACQRAE